MLSTGYRTSLAFLPYDYNTHPVPDLFKTQTNMFVIGELGSSDKHLAHHRSTGPILGTQLDQHVVAQNRSDDLINNDLSRY